MSRAPAFQFYPADWLSSPHITLMSPAEEGAYIRLLCYAWSDPDCSLPDNDDVLAQLSRLGEGWFANGSTAIRKCFIAHPEKTGRLVNLRLLEERNKQEAWREKSRIGGVHSGKSRASGAKGASTTVEANKGRVVEPQANSSSSSSLRIRERKGRRDRNKVELNGHTQTFDTFWAAYPKKEGKKPCQNWWTGKRPDDVLLGIMLSKIEQAKRTPKWQEQNGKFIPMPATWLHQERWEDEYSQRLKHKERIPL